MSHHNDPYRVDYLKIYPCLKERPDVLEVLKKSDRKMKYMLPLQSLIFLAGAYANCKRQLALPALKIQKKAVLSHNTRVVELLPFIELLHQTGFAKSVQYLHSCRLIVVQSPADTPPALD